MASHRPSPPAPFPQWPVLRITKKASEIFLESLEAEGLDPEKTYLRVGATQGGCSGWKFTIKTSLLFYFFSINTKSSFFIFY